MVHPAAFRTSAGQTSAAKPPSDDGSSRTAATADAAKASAKRRALRVGHDGVSNYRPGQTSLAAYGARATAGDPPIGPGADPDGYLGSIDDGRLYVDHSRHDAASSYFNRMTGNMRLEPSETGLLIGLDMPL